MNNEIKEILEYLKDEKWKYYPSDMTPYKVLVMEERDNEKDKEIERLNNVINELEKWLKDNFRDCEIFIENDKKNIIKGNVYLKVLNKLQELKENNNEYRSTKES